MMLIQRRPASKQMRIFNYSGVSSCLGALGLLLLVTSLSTVSLALGSIGSEFSPGVTTFTSSIGDSRKGEPELKSTQNHETFLPSIALLYTDNLAPLESKFSPNGQFVTSESVIGSSPESTLIPEQKTSFYDLTVSANSPIPNLKPHYPNGPNGETEESPSEITYARRNGDLIPSPTSTSLPESLSTRPSQREAGQNLSSINLVRKLQEWSSSRSSKLNLTHEHESLLRVEPEQTSSRNTSPHTELKMSSTLRPTLSVPSAFLTPAPLQAIQLERTRTTAQSVTSTSAVSHSSRPQTLPTPASVPPRYHQHHWNRTGHSLRRRRLQFLYPEWLSASGGVYPDEGNSNSTSGDYSAEPGDYEAESQERRDNSEKDPQRAALMSGIQEQIISDDTPERESSGGSEPESSVGMKGASNRLPSDPVFHPADENSGLADVISRGRIDSVMYVYFGDKFNDYHKEEIAGRIIQAVGGVVAAIAQVLTVLGAARCIRKATPVNILPVQLHVGFALLVSNLLLLLAVHATEPLDVCASVAVILHYLHLVIGAWLLAHTVQTYRALRHYVNAPNLLAPEATSRSELDSFGQRPVVSSSTLRYCALTWAVPFLFIILSYFASPDSYETRRYCWMSIEKGMVVSFIVPVFLLIGLNTMLVIMSLRHLLEFRKLWQDPLSGDGDEDMLDEKAVSSGIRASAMLLPLLAIMWFLGVVALENPTSVFFQLASAVASIVLSWLVMYFLGDEVWPDIWCPFFKKRDSNLSSSIEESSAGGLPSVQPSATVQLPFDSEPLLPCTSAQAQQAAACSTPGPSTSAKSALRWPHKNRPNWSRPGGNEIYELRHDAISTIYK